VVPRETFGRYENLFIDGQSVIMKSEARKVFSQLEHWDRWFKSPSRSFISVTMSCVLICRSSVNGIVHRISKNCDVSESVRGRWPRMVRGKIKVIIIAFFGSSLVEELKGLVRCVNIKIRI
jgi:hypothetical protein